jgi:hypothetical protein
VGGRTYFGPNDAWRLQGYTAWDLMMISLNMACLESGWSDKKRIILTAGNREIEQIGASLTTTNDVLGRSLRHLYFPQGVMVSLRILTSLMLG